MKESELLAFLSQQANQVEQVTAALLRQTPPVGNPGADERWMGWKGAF